MECIAQAVALKYVIGRLQDHSYSNLQEEKGLHCGSDFAAIVCIS